MAKAQMRLSQPKATDHGGELRNKRTGRGARHLTYRHSIHLVLRSSQAKGPRSFSKPQHKSKIAKTVYRHASRNGVRIISFANVGNHLHLHIQLTRQKLVQIKEQYYLCDHRELYCRFIRSITGAIALMIITTTGTIDAKKSFWDRRPFTRYVATHRHYLNMKDYMTINQLEGRGFHRINARFEIAYRYDSKHPPDFDDI
jgi:REP element-mobilizing transposase RayT